MTKVEEGGKEKEAKPQKSPLWLCFNLAFFAFCLVAYFTRHDSLFAFFVWPAFVPAFIGVVWGLFLAPWRKGLLIIWGVFALIFVEEAISIPRMLIPSGQHSLRIVTLNCGWGRVEAVQELKKLNPDVLLLQESPGSKDLRKLAEEFFGREGSFVYGPDATIIARGKLEQIGFDRRISNFVSAKLTTPEGETLNLVSLRMNPPVLRLDLYNPGAWSEFTQSRIARRSEAEEIASHLNRSGFEPDIVAGDFNSPPDARAFGSLTSGLTDSFKSGGRGYGATAVNPLPCLVRIDQVYTSRKIEVISVWTSAGKESDHRAVVADLKIKT